MFDPQPRPFHRVLRADPLSVRRTLTDLRRIYDGNLPDETLGRLELVLAEVMNNVVEHGIGISREADSCVAEAAAGIVPRARAVHLAVHPRAEGLECAITDNGVLIPGACLAPRNLPEAPGDLPEGGFGWYLIQDLVADLSYCRRAGRNHLEFRIPFAAHSHAA